MAFLLECIIDDYEVRGVSTGKSNKGTVFKSINLESHDGKSCEISCTDSDLFSSVDKLVKGDIITCRVRAVSSKKYSYVSLISAPVVKENAYKSNDYSKAGVDY